MLVCPRWSCRPSSFTAPVDCPRGTLDSLCRRAAHPGNLRGKLVSSAALLIRLLPRVQLLLMRFLYFVVRAIATACAGKGCFASQLACPWGRPALRHSMLFCSLPGFLHPLHAPVFVLCSCAPTHSFFSCCRTRAPWCPCSGPAWRSGCCLPSRRYVRYWAWCPGAAGTGGGWTHDWLGCQVPRPYHLACDKRHASVPVALVATLAGQAVQCVLPAPVQHCDWGSVLL